jgi:hypothetical protein
LDIQIQPVHRLFITTGNEMPIEVLPMIDIREFVETTSYVGPTKKGVRFPWDKLHLFIELLEVLVHDLGSDLETDPTLFQDHKPPWIKSTSEPGVEIPSVECFDVAALKPFPTGFLPDGMFESEIIALPADRLKIELDCKDVTSSKTGQASNARSEMKSKANFFYRAKSQSINTRTVTAKAPTDSWR